MKPPLKTVLRNFLNHFESYESRKKLSDDPYEHEFQQLKKLTDKLKNDNEYSSSVAFKDVNRPKNRYKDIVPYDKSRVVLPKCEGIPGSDYINASYVKGASGASAYIAAQGPLPNTVIDFWRMIWICDVQVIVMACNEIEAGKNKCDKYWPSKSEVKNYGNITVELIDTTEVCPDFLIRTLLVKCDSEMRDVYQFHYTSWPDHGIPDTVQPILELVRLMRQCQASETMPIVVHCSAGCGRTGTICAVDFVWACLRHGKLAEDFSLFQIALELRRQRIAMIQTKEQYILAHKVVATLFEQQLSVIDCHPYVNIDEDGEPLIWKELTKNRKALSKNSAEMPSYEDQDKIRALSDLKASYDLKTNGSVEKPANQNPPKAESLRSSLNDFIGAKLSNKQNLQSNMSLSDSLADCSRTSESNISQISQPSHQSNEDSIPFIDDDEVCIRPQGGRAYLNLPSCESISKIVDRFDPFVDKVTPETDESSPEAEIKGFHSKLVSTPKETEKNLTGRNNSDGFQIPKNLEFSNVSTSKDMKNVTNADSKERNSIPFKRESYPSATGNSFSNDCDSTDDKISIQSEQIKGSKKMVKTALVRRPSIAKLKALFEKNSSRPTEGGKRLLFRNNTHSVSRAGSAPPSLNCMDSNDADERESILMMVTRKFRSASVRTEREVNSKSDSKSPKKTTTTMSNFKEGISTLSRTVSFTLNKKIRPTLKEAKVTEFSDSANKNDIDNNLETNLSSTPTKSKSMWYDRSSLPRVVTGIKPTEKSSSPEEPISPTSKKTEKNKAGPFSFNINKPPKLLPFLNNLSRTDGKDTTMWYSETDNTYVKDIPTITSASDSCAVPSDGSKDNTNKGFPSINSFKPWKKVSAKPYPDAIKNPKTLPSSPKFYTNADSENKSKNTSANTPSVCPVPEEIIPLSSADHPTIPATVIDKAESSIFQNTTKSTEIDKVKSEQTISELTLTKNVNQTNTKKEVPPAIPKKIHIGKNKPFDLQKVVTEEKMLDESTPDLKDQSLSQPNPSSSVENTVVPSSPHDLYMNINETTKKNIEQIEKTIRINPRSAIIDLTSRESYCMEEELANAVKQLANPKPIAKGSSKFPGYEVIWPEDKVDVKGKTKLFTELQTQSKKGVGYSPPLRRSFKGNLKISKSNSCSNIDWLEPNEGNSVNNSFKDGPSPTKKLVKEAAVELNTLLDRLTNQTLTESANVKAETKPCNEDSDKIEINSNILEEKETTKMQSVTLVSKSFATSSSPKEEEIVFHFPPPPKNPPPKDDAITESFDIIVKNGSMIVNPPKNEADNSTKENETKSDMINKKEYPQPAPRKIRKSASYTNLWAPQSKGYENVFLEKYQTISRLQIEPEQNDNLKIGKVSDTGLASNKSSQNKALPDYVNVKNMLLSTSKHTPPKLKPFTEAKIFSSKEIQFENKSHSHKTFSVLEDNNDQFSTYGKIQKLPDRKQEQSTTTHVDKHESKIPFSSQKADQTSLSPNEQYVFKTKGVSPNIDSFEKPKTKRLPSRKHEKAPLPPPLLQKSSSVAVSPKKSGTNPPYYVNFPHGVEEKTVLPAVRENIINTDSYVKRLTSNDDGKLEQNPGSARGLSHSQSDASVFFALKERKALSLGRGLKISDPKLLVSNKLFKQNKKLSSVSSSDSDSSYERIFFEQSPGAKIPVHLKQKSPEQTSLQSEKQSHKELPKAPPRARRRNTTEIQYAKVKSKEGKPLSRLITENEKLQKSERLPFNKETPPALPLKTKDAFETLESTLTKEQFLLLNEETPVKDSNALPKS